MFDFQVFSGNKIRNQFYTSKEELRRERKVNIEDKTVVRASTTSCLHLHPWVNNKYNINLKFHIANRTYGFLIQHYPFSNTLLHYSIFNFISVTKYISTFVNVN